jgi:hypothetical protein
VGNKYCEPVKFVGRHLILAKPPKNPNIREKKTKHMINKRGPTNKCNLYTA